METYQKWNRTARKESGNKQRPDIELQQPHATTEHHSLHHNGIWSSASLIQEKEWICQANGTWQCL